MNSPKRSIHHQSLNDPDTPTWIDTLPMLVAGIAVGIAGGAALSRQKHRTANRGRHRRGRDQGSTTSLTIVD